MTHVRVRKAGRHARWKGIRALTAFAAAAATLAATPTGVSAQTGPADGPAAFTPVTPCRLTDTRARGAVSGGATVTVPAAGVCDVPATASAVAVTVTAVTPAHAGHLAVWDGAGAPPGTSTVNFAAGETRANSAIVAVRDGTFAVYTSATTDIVVDVTGVWQPVTGPVRAGRFEMAEPRSYRLADTRTTGRANRLELAAPAPHTAAVVVTVTLVATNAAGYATVYPSGAARPVASAVNADGPNQTRANTVTVPVGPDGRFVVEQVHAGGHLVVDYLGRYTSDTAPKSSYGLFIPAGPTRSIDTRALVREDAPDMPWLVPHGATRVHVTDSWVSAVAVNVTLVAHGRATHLAVGPGIREAANSTTSAVNAGANDGAVAAHTTAATTTDGNIGVAAGPGGGDVIVDVTGVFTGDPAVNERSNLATDGSWPITFKPDTTIVARARALLPEWLFTLLRDAGWDWVIERLPGDRAGQASAEGVISLQPSVLERDTSIVRTILLHEAAHALDLMFAGFFGSSEMHRPGWVMITTDGFGHGSECVADAAALLMAGPEGLAYMPYGHRCPANSATDMELARQLLGMP